MAKKEEIEQLIQTLQNPDWKARKEAAKALVMLSEQLPDPESVVPLFLAAVTKPNQYVQLTTAITLGVLAGRLPDPTPIVPALLTPLDDVFFYLKEEQEAVRKTLKASIPWVEDPVGLIKTFLAVVTKEDPAYWDSGDPEVTYDSEIPRGAVADIFVELVDTLKDVSQVLPILQATLHDENAWLRVTAARALTKRADELESSVLESLVPILLEAIESVEFVNPGIAEALATLALHLEDLSPLIPALLKGMYNNPAGTKLICEVRKGVLRTLSTVGLRVADPAPIVDDLLDIIRDAHVDYGRTSDPEDKEIVIEELFKLIEGLEDPAFMVLKLTQTFLEYKYAGEDEAQLLLDFLKRIAAKLANPTPVLVSLVQLHFAMRTKPIIQSATNETLESVKERMKITPSIVLPFLQAAARTNHTVQEEVAKIQANMVHSLEDPTPVVMELVTQLSNEDKAIRTTAAMMLGTIGNIKALEPLLQILQEENGEVRAAVMDALGSLGDERAVEPLRIIMKLDPDHSQRRIAAEILNELGWTPKDVAEQAHYLIARQDWEEVIHLGEPAIPPLVQWIFLSRSVDLFTWDIQKCAKVLKPLGKPAVDALLQVMQTESGYHATAARILGHLGDPRVIPPFLQVLQEGDGYYRKMVAEALDNLGWTPEVILEKILYFHAKDDYDAVANLGKSAFVPLRQMLQDEEWSIRKDTVKSLGKLGDMRAVGLLIHVLGTDTSGSVRSAAAEALGTLEDARAIHSLVQALQDTNWYTREAAVKALERLNWHTKNQAEQIQYLIIKEVWKEVVRFGDLAIDPLVQLLWDSPEWRGIRKATATTLDTLDWHPKNILEQVQYFLSKHSWDDLVELGDVAIDPLIQELQEYTGSTQSPYYEGIITILGEIGDIRATTPLCQQLSHSFVRKLASEALVRIGEPAIPVLQQALRDKHPEIRKGAAAVLDTLGWQLEEVTEQAQYLIAQQTWTEIVRLGSPAVNPLVRILTDQDEPWEIRVRAALALGEIGDPRVVEPLTHALNDTDYYVQVAAQEALKKLQKQENIR